MTITSRIDEFKIKELIIEHISEGFTYNDFKQSLFDKDSHVSNLAWFYQNEGFIKRLFEAVEYFKIYGVA